MEAALGMLFLLTVQVTMLLDVLAMKTSYPSVGGFCLAAITVIIQKTLELSVIQVIFFFVV